MIEVSRFSFLAYMALVLFDSAVTQAELISPSEFIVADGFEITVWATTPQLYNPTNFDVDSKGRLWVTEAVNYRNFRNESLGLSDKGGDRVAVLQDTDGDGKADSSHTFVRDPDLVAPLGIGVIGNKVVVSCAPNILVYTDVDGDARFDPKTDTKEVFLTGFRGLDHDHSLHSVKVGPDGYWYFNVGNGGPHTVTDKAGWTLRAGSSYAGGSPHLRKNTPGRKSDDGRVWVGGVGMRIRPDGTGLEPIAHNFRNAYEETVTSFGDVFHADNDDPPACRTSWVMEYGNAGFSSADGSRGWKIDQRPGQPIRVAEWRQEDPGTMPAGDVYGSGAPTGVVYGENGCFESKYPDGLLLTCESARGEVFGYVPRSQGAGFTLERFNFAKVKAGSPNHGWFRPSDVAIGVDGAIYVSDWYDPGVGGHRMTDTTGSGTIYRITPRGFKPEVPRFDLSTTGGQVAALKSPTANVRALGFEALKKGGQNSASKVIELADDEDAFFAARAVWLLPYCGADGIAKLMDLLNHDDAQMRIAAFRAVRRASNDEKVQRRMKRILKHAQASLYKDRSSAVRREVALSLRDVPLENCGSLIAGIAEGYDGWDRWYLEALGTACEGDESAAYDLLVEDANVDPLEWDRRLTGIAWRLHPPSAIEALTARAMAADMARRDRKRMVNALAFIPDARAAESMLALATKGPEDLRGLAAWWGKSRHTNDWKEFNHGDKFPEAPKVQGNKKKPTQMELDFTLASKPVFVSSGGNTEIDIDVSGAKRLYLVCDSVGEDNIDAKWINPTLVHAGGDTDLTSQEWAMAFSGSLTSVFLDGKKKAGWRRPKVLSLPTVYSSEGADSDSSISVKTRSVIAYDIAGKGGEHFHVAGVVDSNDSNAAQLVRFSIHLDRSSGGDEMPSIADLAKIPASATHGRALFQSKRLGCFKCHTANGFGGEIGPDLTQIAKKHAQPVLFEGILKPSAAIATGFETMQVVTSEGKVINGLMVSAGDPVVLKDAEGKFHTIAKRDVEIMQSGKVSIMPELKKLLTADEVASLVAYLQYLAAQ